MVRHFFNSSRYNVRPAAISRKQKMHLVGPLTNMRIDEFLIYVGCIAAAFKAPSSVVARIKLRVHSHLGCQGFSVDIGLT